MTYACSPRNGLPSENTHGDIVEMPLQIVPPLLVVYVISLLTDVPVNGFGGMGEKEHVAKHMFPQTSPPGL